ncbi:serine/threonine-protein kinase [Aeoliella mucimassa]|uniref:Serine/threonine-protein kinase PrkC n=1 Tax=Aeoliella mucimassa TaxID=2527972 RepID=A0A518ATG1_9BACT|nr:serine/threonine-protein kinase [Aeoliella mucimassa]QDU57996.1 Serine/threonine-protein kinase PrkC [Aeoliella mucimassa]
MPTTSMSPRPVKIVSDDTAPPRRKMIGRAGPWQLVRLIAETNLARLYTARPAEADEALPASYMVKMLRKEWWRDEVAVELFRREVWVGSRVSHPHVVPVLSANVRQPPFYAAMPMLEGETLRQRLDRQWQPSLSEALWLVRQMAEGLSAIDRATGMVHGDVKPDNVMVAPTGHVTLIDLGFARRPGDDHGRLADSLMGSLAYIAPEVVTSAFATGISSDQYSLGIVMYELLSGRTPFTSNDPGELIALHRGQKPPCIRSLRPDLPKPVASLVHTLLAKDPIRRSLTYRELIERLVRLEIEMFVPARST